MIANDPPAFVVMLPSAVVPPTRPPNVVAPVVFATRAKPPFNVLLNVMAPAPAAIVVSVKAIYGLASTK